MNSVELIKEYPFLEIDEEYTKEDHMVEYVQTGNAWNKKTMVKTGKEYNR